MWVGFYLSAAAYGIGWGWPPGSRRGGSFFGWLVGWRVSLVRVYRTATKRPRPDKLSPFFLIIMTESGTENLSRDPQVILAEALGTAPLATVK